MQAQAQPDGGGRDIRVQLFSAEPVRRVAVLPAGAGAWWAECAACRHQPLVAALHLPSTREIVAGGPLTVRDEEHAQERTANGQWHLRAAGDGAIDVVLSLPSERYVEAVLLGETAPGEPQESLRAMAVVARTFALRSTPGKATAGHLASDVCDSTACQAMRLGAVPDAISEAARSTAGETLWFRRERAEVFFSASCGGTTESAGAVWPRLAGLPYLRSFPDPYCVRKDHAAWHAEIALKDLETIAAREGWHLPERIVSVAVAERTSSHRARTVVLTGDRGDRAAVSASALRLAVGRSLGWNLLRSDAYDLHLRDAMLAFDGQGHGHGVGLCQQGATEMARAGKRYHDILALYFPGTAVRITRGDEGWKQVSQSGITFNGTAHPSAALAETALGAWGFARSRFPVREQVHPTVTSAPTTEVFRQLTSQPGWQVASTAGSTVVLQPEAVFAANHVSVREALEHEMLHVAVESAASGKAPLWLREGLVEVLAGEAAGQTPALSAAETERLLRSPASRQESQAAHVAAGSRARLMVERYGMSAMRGWLTSGSPVPER